MSSVVDASYDIAQSVKTLPSTIREALTEVYADVFVWLQDMKQSVTDFYVELFVKVQDITDGIMDLPTIVGETIKSIFLPETDYIETKFLEFTDEIKQKFNVDTGFFENLFDDESPVEDVNVSYKFHGLGTLNLKVFDTKYLVDGVEFFRPFIRGFLVLLMCLYNIKQLIGFFGFNAGVVPGRNDAIESARKGD